MRRWLLVCALGCGDAAPATENGDSSGGTQDDTTSTSSPPGTTSTVTTEAETSETGETSGPPETTGGLPDYSNSPCWGEAGSTLVYNGETHQTGSVPVTCRAEGERTLLYVEDELWDAGVDQGAVNRFMHRFEIFTPDGSHDPDQGVITNNEEIFGELPQSKVEIYVVDTGGGGDGYLCGWCTTPSLHLDGAILVPLDGDFPVSIAAHESYHLIHRAVDNSEDLWVDESLAEAAMTANGFFTDIDWLASFLSEPDQNWGPANPELGEFNYGAGLLWGTLLWERGGPDLMRAITHEPADGWAGLDAALASVGDEKTAWELYQDLMVAIYLDDPEGGYGFAFFDVDDVAREGDIAGGAMVSGGLSPYGLDYWRVTTSGTVMMTVTGSEPITALAVVSEDAVTVTPIATDTEVTIAAGASDAFVVLTAEAPATYDLFVN